MVDDGTDKTELQASESLATDQTAIAPGTPREAEVAATVAAPPTPPPSIADLAATKPMSPGALASTPPAMAVDNVRYTLQRLLGQGGMGEVVLAFDEQIGREVAVKRIRAERPSPEELSRFLREARVQGRLQHPAVVPVHDLALDKHGKPYFVMKRLSGTTMAERLEKIRAGDPDEDRHRRELLRAFADVCLAIEFAHSASTSIIHRDLKPANIMLGEYGEVYVLDWGIARAVTDPEERPEPAEPTTPRTSGDLELDSGETRAGTVLGTPAYMAPEQLAGERAGPAADIYALGCILYEIASGGPLHTGRRSLTKIMRPLDAKPSSKRPDSPPELDAICERATKLDPALRYPSARALGEAVQAFLDGDRDVAVRRELAQHHIKAAREALAGGDANRIRAMQAAGRALALDPTAEDAADIVTRLMLEPPKEMPEEVKQHLTTLDTETARAQGRLAALAMFGYLAFIPILLWTGMRELALVGAFGGLAVGSALQVWQLTRRDYIWRPGIYINACINAALIALVCRLVGPFIIAPTLVTTTLIGYAAHPSFGNIGIISGILAAGVAVPWGLEVAGILDSTYRFTNGELVLASPNLTFSAAPVQLAFAVLLFVLVAVVALLTRVLASRQREAQQQLELQAWHLRQIVPTRAPQTA